MTTDDASSQKDTAPSSRALRRHTDTHRFVERFEALTGIRLRSTSVEGLPREFLGQPVPSPDLLARTYGYDLEPRTHNALCRFEPGRANEWTYGRLLEIRGFGVFCLLDLLEVMAKHGHLPIATASKAAP